MSELDWFHENLRTRMVDQEPEKVFLFGEGESKKGSFQIEWVNYNASNTGRGFVKNNTFINFDIVQKMLAEQEKQINSKDEQIKMLEEKVCRKMEIIKSHELVANSAKENVLAKDIYITELKAKIKKLTDDKIVIIQS